MLTVAQAADVVSRHPETIRRWIRTGRLLATRDGHTYLIAASDIGFAVAPKPDWAELIHAAREERVEQLLAVLRDTR
jgi:excisionase family DNA binding protein